MSRARPCAVCSDAVERWQGGETHYDDAESVSVGVRGRSAQEVSVGERLRERGE